MKVTKIAAEEYLNNMYSESLTLEQAREQFSYLASRNVIDRCYMNYTLGTLLRRKDPIAFECSRRDF